MGIASPRSNILHLEVVQAVLVHDVYPAQLGDREIQEGTPDCHRPVAFATFLDLSLRALAVGEALGNGLAHCFRFTERGDEGLHQERCHKDAGRLAVVAEEPPNN